MQSINTVCICGAGTMGNGIAQVCASAGYQTILFDIDDGILNKAKSTIENNLRRLVEKKRINPSESEKVLKQISFTSDINDCISDLVIEAIVEKYEAKISLFQQLLKINTPQTIFATNTSSLSVTKIAESLKQHENLIGLHFFNPPTLMKLVEVIETKYTSQEVINAVLSLANDLSKVSVVCIDSPGFIVNRVARPFYIESLRLIEEEKLNFETLDKLLEDRGFKMGPFKLMDVIGNDINFAVSSLVYEQLNKPTRLKPSFIQKEKIEKGALGKKTGEGYYNYNANPE